MKKIGIIGGLSSESTIEYYRLLNDIYHKQTGNFPIIVVYSMNLEKFVTLLKANRKEEILKEFIDICNILENSGVDFGLIASNTPHIIFNELKAKTNLPLISIAKATAEKANKTGLKNILLLGTKFTMKAKFYLEEALKLGLKIIVPSEQEQDTINDIIWNELVYGKIIFESKTKLVKIIENYKVDGVILGCTELPLLINQEDLQIKVLDTLKIHVESALEKALIE